MPGSPEKPRCKPHVAPRAKVWLELDGQYVFGRGISEILKAVAATGSIKGAARETGKSCRYVWAKIKQTERALGLPLVCTQVGGKDAHRSNLSDVAQELVHHFDMLRERVFELVEEEYHRRLDATLKQHKGTPSHR